MGDRFFNDLTLLFRGLRFSPFLHRNLISTNTLARAAKSIRLVGRSLSKMWKQWSSLVSKCVLTLSAKLQDSKAPKHLVQVPVSLLPVAGGESSLPVPNK